MQSATALVKKKNLTVDKEELRILKQIEKEGRFGVMIKLRDLFIQNANVNTPIVTINTGISSFQVHVSKFKQAGTETVVTETYTDKGFKYSFTKEPVYIPDYKAMRSFWHTCLIHHLDSDLMDWNLLFHKDLWILDVHDADLCLPGQAKRIKKSAAKRLEFYRDNRYKIISNYRQSIGATTPRSDVQYMNLCKSIKDAGDVPFSHMLMK